MKIRKFWEGLDYGRVSNRIAYVVDPTNLPAAMPGSAWKEDVKFDERIAVSLTNPLFKGLWTLLGEMDLPQLIA
jgi:hypothetical protein